MTASNIPHVTPLTAPFWSGVSHGILRVQRCESCGRRRFYPSESCPHCAAPESCWVDLSGRGAVYSWTVVRRSVDAEWQAKAPYCVAVVEIAEETSVLIPGVLHGVDPARIEAGMDVVATFTTGDDGVPQFGWRPE